MKIYTKKGDAGYTSILGKDKVSKDDLRVNAYGTIDELNSILGMCLIHVKDNLNEQLKRIQSIYATWETQDF